MQKNDSMNNSMLQLAESCFKLRERDIGEYARLRGSGMNFFTGVYDAAGAGSLFLMDIKAPLGLMKMQTSVFSPTELDGPILSLDFVEAFGTCTLVLELYDTTLSHPDFQQLEKVKAEYSSLPDYDPGEHWFDSIRLPVSAHKKGRKLRAEMLQMVQEYAALYFELLQHCKSCDAAEKKAENAKFADGLLQNGGPAVNQFRKMVGEEKTAAFIRTCMFCCE